MPDEIKMFIVGGSYGRGTAIGPKMDVDIVIMLPASLFQPQIDDDTPQSQPNFRGKKCFQVAQQIKKRGESEH